MKNHYELKLSRWRKIFSLSVVFVLLFIVSCKKNNTQIVMDNNLSTEDAKLIYDAQYRAENIGNNENNLEPLWDKPMELTRLDTGIALKFPISQSSNPYFLSTIVFKKNLAGSYDVKMKEIKVDSNYYNRFKNNEINNLMNRVDFSGKVYTKTLANRIENIQAYANGNLLYESTIITIKNIEETGQLGGKGKMMSVANGSGSSQQIVNYSIQLRSVPMHMLICTRSVSFTIYPGVSPMYAEVLSKVKQTCSTTQATNSPDVAYQIFIDLRGIAQNLVAQNNSTDEHVESSGSYGGSSGQSNSGSYVIPENPYIPDQDKSAIDPEKYIKCFNNISNVGATYKVIVQVEEPLPGTRINWTPSNGVGHTAITIMKKGSDGVSITQTIGFYPAGSTASEKLLGPSKIVDNAKIGDSNKLEFTVSMEFNLGNNTSAFDNILNYISSPPSTYELFGMNCTAFVVGACSSGNITLPSALNGVAGFSDPLNLVQTMVPAGLGNAMRAAKANGDTRVKTNQATAPQSKGACN
jgi:hypothetical protein